MKLADFCLQMVLDPQFPGNTQELQNDHLVREHIKYWIQVWNFSKIKFFINTVSAFPVGLDVSVIPGD